MVYSQRDEEPIILKNAPEIGRYLDIGAFDGMCFSNSRALFDRGWSGVLVEPSPEAFCGLMKNTKGADRLELVNAAATPGPEGLVRFHASPDAISTTEQAHVEKWKSVANYTPIWVPAISVNRVIQQFGGKFDFITVDTERTSFDILKAIDLNACGCNLVCVEMDDNIDQIRAHFAAVGFQVIHVTGENMIAKRA